MRIEREALALGLKRGLRQGQGIMRRAHRDAPLAMHRVTAGAGDVGRDGRDAAVGRGDRHQVDLPLALGQLIVERFVGRDQHRPRGGERHVIGAGRAVGVVHQQGQRGLVAGRQEARQHHVGDHGIAHDQLGIGLADRGGAERDRHQAQLALEIGHVERHRRGAVGGQLDDSREQRDRFGRHHRQAAAADAVAALAQPADRAVAVEQPAVIVADLDAEPALAEIECVGRRVWKRVSCRMPSSTAATVTKVASPALAPVTRIGSASGRRGTTLSGAPIATASVRGAKSSPTQARPIARTGSRALPLSSGRNKVAMT